jgi:general secretion pathway protein D
MNFRHNIRSAARAMGLLFMTAFLTIRSSAAAQQTFTPNWRENTDIQVIADVVAEATGKVFIIDPRVRAQVTMMNPQPMTAAQLYAFFLSILQVNNFVALESGGVVKIVPDVNVRSTPGNDLPATVNPNSDEIVTQVITAKNISAAQLATVLRPLVAQYGNLAPVPGTNSLLITDRANNVSRIMRIVARVDQAGDANVEIIPLQNSTATDIVRTLSSLMTGAPAEAGGSTPPRIVADERSNSILISGDSAQRLRVATLIAHLDTPVENGGDTQVRYLKYADAEKVQAILKQQQTGVAAATTATAGAAAAAADRSVTIVADKQTNALIVTAPPKSMRSLLTIVDKLDIPRAQVMVEAIIADVSTEKSADIGVNWAVFSNENGTNVPAASFVSPVGSANGNPVSLIDLTKAIANPAAATVAPLGTTFGIGRLRDNGVNFGAMIRLLRADTNTNVIATPQLTTADNQQAEFKSAQEVPFITGQYANSGTGGGNSVNPFTTVQRQEVGTILKIKPQLNGGDAMTLEIELESSELAGSSGDAGSAITNKRTFKNTVLVQDGQTIVVAGLIRDSKITGESRVPFLGRIPVLGEAFKTRNGRRSQSNLMVFIRPTILTDSIQASIETNNKYNAIRDAQRAQGNRAELLPLLPFDKAPQLPVLVQPAAPETAPAPAATPPATAKEKP